jgi:putative PIN family toxin of toxin-antitoxin system
MRVVLDTNILISGLLWAGQPRQLLDAAHRGELQLFTTSILLDELADVLQREKFASRLEQAGVTSSTLVRGYAALATLIEPQEIPPTILDDPDDDAVLACAITANAQAIVSGDSHLLNLAVYATIPILTATELLTQLKPES